MEDTANHHVLAPSDLILGPSNLDMNPTTTTTNGFVAVDVGALSSLAGDAADSATPSPISKVVRSLSRKGERKPADGDVNIGTPGGAAGTGERAPLFVHVVSGDSGELNGHRHVHTPVAVGTPGGKSRRLGRRPAPWLDPRRVVFLFATLSSVGTLILLYFTLSMGKMDAAGNRAATDSDAR